MFISLEFGFWNFLSLQFITTTIKWLDIYVKIITKRQKILYNHFNFFPLITQIGEVITRM